MKHIVKEGSREHVLWWDSEGTHCSEPDCEVNKRNTEVAELEAENERLRELLEHCQWGGQGDGVCPVCAGDGSDGHYEDYQLLDALLEGKEQE